MNKRQISKDTGDNLRKSAKKEKWNNFKEKSMDVIVKGGSAVGNNRFLVAIRDAFTLPFALITGASIPLILANLFFNKNSLIGQIPGVADSTGMYWVDYLIGQPFNACFNAITAGFSLYIAVGLGFFIARSYGKDGILAGALGIGIFFIMKPLANVEAVRTIFASDRETIVEEAKNVVVGTNYLASNGLIVTLLMVMLGVWIYVKLSNVKWLVPKMPDSVPPMVAKSFGAIFTSAITLVLFAFISHIWFIIATEANLTTTVITAAKNADGVVVVTQDVKVISTIFIAIESILAGPLSAIGMNIGTTMLIGFLIAFFWFFGIHGSNIMQPVINIVWKIPILQNIEYWQKWLNKDYAELGSDGYWNTEILVQGNMQQGLIPVPMAMLGEIGGTGATLGLLIAIFIFSKNKTHRELAKLSIAPGIFSINEPVSFGFPIVLNPVFFLPYVFINTAAVSLGHMFILLHWMRPAVIQTPSLPYGINVFFASGFDWRALVLSLANLGVVTAMWLPMVWIVPKYEEKVAIKLAEKKEQEKAAKLAAKEKKAEQLQETKKES